VASGLSLTVIIAGRKMNNLNIYFKNTKPTSAILSAIRNIAKDLSSMRKIAIEVSGNPMNQNGFTRHGIENHIQGESPILKPKGMLDKETLKEAIHWKSGKNYRDNINIVVPFAASI